MDRILVVNVNWLGDVVFSLPIFKALKTAYPNAMIACLAVPRVKEVLESNLYIDHIVVYDEEASDRSLLGKIKLIGRLRRLQFDVAFLLHRSFTRALLIFLAGIPQRVGYDTKNRGFLLTHRVNPLPEGRHRWEVYRHVLESYGIRVNGHPAQLQVDSRAEEEVGRLLEKEGIRPDDFLVVVNAGGNWDLKRWPQEHFSELINRLMNELNARVIMPGALKDRELVHGIVGASQVRPLIWAGQTSLKQLMALLKKAHLVISADSGPLHLAAGLGTPVIGLFGPTRWEITGPRPQGPAIVIQKDVGCNREPCYYLSCPDNVCMKSITVDEVMDAVRQLRG